MEPRPVVHREASPDPSARPAPARVARRAAPSECDIRLTLPARAENVALVRHVVAALAEALHLPDQVVEDVKLAVTEACTNVVRHAYDDADGPLDVRVHPDEDCLTVVVTDRGSGIRTGSSSSGAGLGLPLIAALASQMEIEEGAGRGSCIRMSFTPGATLRPA